MTPEYNVNPSEHQSYPLNKPDVKTPEIEGEEVKHKDKGMKTPGIFPCSLCDYIAKTEQGLKVHMTRSHPEPKEEETKEEIKNEKETKESQEPTKEKVEEKVKTPEVKDEVKDKVQKEVKKGE